MRIGFHSRVWKEPGGFAGMTEPPSTVASVKAAPLGSLLLTASPCPTYATPVSGSLPKKQVRCLLCGADRVSDAGISEWGNGTADRRDFLQILLSIFRASNPVPLWKLVGNRTIIRPYPIKTL
jgi:hypothetical protein